MARRRTWHYFIGDIHGCHEELLALEDKIARHAARSDVRAHIVSVGDLVDRGPESAQVVRHVREGVEAGTHSVVMGNHEAIMLAVLWDQAPWSGASLPSLPQFLTTVAQDASGARGWARSLATQDYRAFRRYMWQGQGGFDTLLSFGCDPHDPGTWSIDPQDLAFLLRMPMVWENQDFVVTHALCAPEHLEVLRAGAPEFDAEDEEVAAYRASASHAMWSRAPLSSPPDPERVHISGHTPLGRLKRTQQRRVIQLDTGCVYGRRLTAWCGEGDEILSVKGREHIF